MLLTINFAFRVHKAILASQSSVFKDMFDIISPNYEGGVTDGAVDGAVDWENLDSVPVLCLSGDSEEDVVCLLGALYGRRCAIKRVLLIRFH